MLYAIRLPGWVQVAAFGLLLALASVMVGVLVGFLFGIPRALQNAGTGGAEAGWGRYSTNTNLEQISDWLTKILVGVGLVELARAIY